MTDGERKIQYYVWEIEMSDDFANHLRQIAAKGNMTLEEMTERALMYITEHPETLSAWKTELDSLPQEQKSKLGNVKVLRIYPVYTGETEVAARERVLLNENQTLSLCEMSQREFCDHIEDDDFFLVYGNPVIVHGDDGQKLVCMAWPMAERILRMTGRGDEADEVIRKAKEMQDNNGEA